MLGTPKDRPQRVLAMAWLDVQYAALCIQEEVVFDLRERTCPSCGSRVWMPLTAWLNKRKERKA